MWYFWDLLRKLCWKMCSDVIPSIPKSYKNPSIFPVSLTMVKWVIHTIVICYTVWICVEPFERIICCITTVLPTQIRCTISSYACIQHAPHWFGWAWPVHGRCSVLAHLETKSSQSYCMQRISNQILLISDSIASQSTLATWQPQNTPRVSVSNSIGTSWCCCFACIVHCDLWRRQLGNALQPRLKKTDNHSAWSPCWIHLPPECNRALGTSPAVL